MNIRRIISLGLLAAAALAGAGSAMAQQDPVQALDASWSRVCANAVPGSPFFQRCQEIINAGPGSANRRSEAAQGNNFDTVAGQGRLSSQSEGASERFEWAQNGLFVSLGWQDHRRRAEALEAAFDGEGESLLVGWDHRLGERTVVGIAASHQRERARFDAGAGHSRLRHLGLHGFIAGSFSDAFGYDGYLGFARSEVTLSRTVAYQLLLTKTNRDKASFSALAAVRGKAE